MSAADPYFTFPLSALRYGNSPHDMLDALLCYGIVYAGLNTPAKRFDDLYAQAAEELSIKTLPAKSNREGRAVLVGAKICKVRLSTWEGTLERYRSVHDCCGAGEWRLRIKAYWLWRALDTTLVEANLPSRNAWFDYRSHRIAFRDFRILAAILSAIGAKPFDWLSWKTIQCRASGFMRREDFGNGNRADIPVFLKPPLTRWQIDRTTKDLEAWGFLARFRLSTGKCGGRYAYSVRCKDRDELSEVIRESKAERGKYSISENRARDVVESLSIQENRKSPANGRQPPDKQTNKSPATQIQRPAIESPDIKTNPIKTRIGHTTNEVDGASSSLSDWEIHIIEAYNRFCDTNNGRRFLKVDQVTYRLRGALAQIDGMEAHELLEILESEAQNPRGGRTFIECVWKNYH